eukprot:gene26860-biopygen5515
MYTSQLHAPVSAQIYDPSVVMQSGSPPRCTAVFPCHRPVFTLHAWRQVHRSVMNARCTFDSKCVSSFHNNAHSPRAFLCYVPRQTIMGADELER